MLLNQMQTSTTHPRSEAPPPGALPRVLVGEHRHPPLRRRLEGEQGGADGAAERARHDEVRELPGLGAGAGGLSNSTSHQD